MKNEIQARAREWLPRFEEISEYLFSHPELGGQEEKACRYLTSFLEKNGFRIEYPYGSQSTAFRAEFGHGNPVVAFLAEYDALPGYGEAHDQIAHACGHNWIAASSVGAAIVLSSFLSQEDVKIVVIGTPAEESIGGKCVLVQEGAFCDVDAVFQMHLAARTVLMPKIQAMDSIEFEFFGKASHAALAPEEGINALDAVISLFNGLNQMRAQLSKEDSIMGIITNGGSACNIIPEYASCQFYVRSCSRKRVDALVKRMISLADGASLMTGAKMSYRFFEQSFDSLVADRTLSQYMKENLELLGVHEFQEMEEWGGSSDIGNVSQVVPCAYVELDTGAVPSVFAHEEAFLDLVHGPKAQKSLYIAICAMAMSAWDFLDKK